MDMRFETNGKLEIVNCRKEEKGTKLIKQNRCSFL